MPITSQELQQRAEKIRLIIFDVDGVLTDGGLYRLDDGQEMKRFHSRDGLGMRLLKEGGLDTAIITGRTSKVVSHRAGELGVKWVYQGKKHKLPAFLELCETASLTPDQVAYMGDDLIDLPVLMRAGLALAPGNAHPEVLQRAHWKSSAMPGNGAAREASEMLLKAIGKWDEVLAGYLQ